MQTKGVLQDKLLDHVWRDILNLNELKPTLLSLMEMFDLLMCPREDSDEVGVFCKEVRMLSLLWRAKFLDKNGNSKWQFNKHAFVRTHLM